VLRNPIHIIRRLVPVAFNPTHINHAEDDKKKAHRVTRRVVRKYCIAYNTISKSMFLFSKDALN